MSIQRRITLLFTVLAAGILLLFTGIVYFSAYQNRLNEFYGILEKEALTKVNLLLETQLDAKTLQTIYRNNREVLYEVEVAIYDQNRQLIYHDAVDIDFVKETTEMLNEINNKEYIRFVQDNWQVVGMLMVINGESYLVTAAAYDEYGFNKLENLRNTILITFLLGLVLIYLVGKYFSRKTLEPISEMIQEAKKISASNLDLRLKVGNGKDELGQLAGTFNEMLERLEKSFDSQKQFVGHLSHELRTPLSAIISELELSGQKERALESYRETIQNVLSDARKMAKLSGTLLDFAKASFDRSEVNFKPLRLDETLLDAGQLVQQASTGYQIDLDFEGNIEEEEITIMGNVYLLTIAFTNLMENACKFSEDQKCTVSIAVSEGSPVILFSDRGKGIPEEELEMIFNPFFRGSNKEYSEGSGIGLALVKKIVQLHQGEITVRSTQNKGSVFSVSFPMSR